MKNATLTAVQELGVSLARVAGATRTGALRKVFSGLAAATLLCGSLSANAIMISVAPSMQTVSVGDSLFVDVVISDLGAGAAPTIGAFDIDVMFDTGVLDLTSVVFGTGLDVLGLGSLQGVIGTGPINVFEVSLDNPGDLRALQADSFTLFTMNFDALAAGMSGIDLMVNDLSSAGGRSFPRVGVASGEVSVERAQDMPEPATMLLFGLGLAGLGFARRSNRGR